MVDFLKLLGWIALVWSITVGSLSPIFHWIFFGLPLMLLLMIFGKR